METLGQWWEKPQIVEFENLYPNISEIKEVSKLQEKLEIKNWLEFQLPLWWSLGFYYGSDPDLLYNKSTLKSKFLGMFPDFIIPGQYLSSLDIKWTVIKIKKCYQTDGKYIFINDIWYIYTVDKKDFDDNWYMAKSLAFLKEPLRYKKSDISCSAKDWKVEYCYKEVTEWTLGWTCFVPIDIDSNQQQIYVGNKSYIYKTQLITSSDPVTKNKIVQHNDSDAIDLWLWEIKKILLDVNQNLLFVVSEDEDWNSDLHILDHKKLFAEWSPVVDEIKKIEWVSDIDIFMDGDLVLYRTNWKTDFLNTNINSLNNAVGWWFKMKTITVNKANNSTKQDVIDSLWTGTISLDTNKISNEWNEEDEKIINWIWDKNIEINWVTSTLKELLDNAETKSDIENVREWLHLIIKQNEKLSKVPELLKVVDRKITEKSNKISLKIIYDDLWNLTDELWKASDLTTLITIQDKLKMIRKERGRIQVWILDEDKELDALLKSVDLKIKEYQEDKKDEYEEEIQTNLERIKEILDDVMNLIDVSTIYTNELYVATTKMINNLPPESKEKFEKKLKQVVSNRRGELRSESEKSKKEERNKIEKRKKEIEEQIDEIKETLDDIDSIEAIEEYKEADALVDIIKKSLEELPNIDAQQLELKLDRIFSERIFKLRLWCEENKWVIKSLDTYWIDTMLYFNEEESEWIDREIEWEEQSNWKIKLVIRLSNGETHRYDKSLLLKEAKKFRNVLIKKFPIKFEMTWNEYLDLQDNISNWESSWKKDIKELSDKLINETDDEKREKIRGEIKEIKEKYKDARYTEIIVNRLIKQQKLKPRTKVPRFDPNFIVLDEEKEILKTLSARLVDQKLNWWVETLAWWPWLWKTVMCKFLAAVTKRELVIVQCSKMDPNDMFFSTELVDDKTEREPAEWIKQMQKPGSIILFDEIDKLSPDCFARLHDLFDGRRTVNDPKKWPIEANPDCLFLWTMNTYDKLTNPINNRWRILEISYPDRLNESYKVSKYANSPTMKKMSFEEFQMLYEKYVIRGEQAPSSAQEKNIYNIIMNINHLLNVFTTLRGLYGSDTPYVYELSYRDARQIFVDYNNKWDFKKAMENILIPKSKHSVVDPEEKKEQETMVMAAIIEEMGL